MTTTKAVWGRNIRNRREALGLTQKQLGEAVDVRQATVCQWETGTNAPRDEHRIALAQVLKEDYFSLFPVIVVAA